MLGGQEDSYEAWSQAAEAMPGSLRALGVRTEISERMDGAVPSVPQSLEALQDAHKSIRAGMPKVALRQLASAKGAEGAALRLRALADLGASGQLYREVRRFRAEYPERIDELSVIWRVSSWRMVRVQQEVIESAAHALAGDDLELLYRAWRLFIFTGQENLAAAAGARIGREEASKPLPGRLPWGVAMIRDLSRALFRSPEPVLPASASVEERIAIWTELSRLASVAGELENAAAFSKKAVDLGGPIPAAADYPSMPLVSMKTTHGPVSFGEGSKRSVILNVWATWCGPCQEELPQLELMAQRFAEEGIDLPVIAVSMDKQQADFQRYLKEHPFSAVAMVWLPELNSQLGGEVLPTTYYIDSEGKIRLKREGYKKGETERLEALVRGYLE